LVILYSEVIKI